MPELLDIRSVTYTVPDLRTIEESYTRWLGYRVVSRGVVAAAAAWLAPAIAGASMLTLGPASLEPVHLHFIESRNATGWRSLTTHGWNVSEFVVQDVDGLATALADSPFRIIGAPASLQRFPMIRAMQVRGPGGECLYFTEVGPGSGLNLATAQSYVGRVFIVVAGGPNLESLFRTYAPFSNALDPPVSTRVRVISEANNLAADTEHRHGLVKLPAGTLVELDQYPAATLPRLAALDTLPPGMAMVSFNARGLATTAATTLRGAAGERIELWESDHG